jgi:hypothetical protein
MELIKIELIWYLRLWVKVKVLRLRLFRPRYYKELCAYRDEIIERWEMLEKYYKTTKVK